MFSSIGPWELAIILLIALMVVGPGKLPEVARSIGKGLNEFKKVTNGVKREFDDMMKEDLDAKKAAPQPANTVEAVNPLDQIDLAAATTVPEAREAFPDQPAEPKEKIVDDNPVV